MAEPKWMHNPEILLVDDNSADIELTRLALLESGMPHRFHAVTSGVHALKFLKQIGAYLEAPRPDFILLDINMPGMNGHEVLSQIKFDEDLRSIPVVILTTSDAPHDISLAYRNYANSYVTKRIEFTAFIENVIKPMCHYWFQVAEMAAVRE
ncbi:MAG: response regulator [Planctomycetota bacterium]|nr:response regulator [Planctomycetota bacterium]